VLASANTIMPTVHLLDYVAGNIRSLVNAIEKLGYTVEMIKSPEDIPKAEVSYSANPFTSMLSTSCQYHHQDKC